MKVIMLTGPANSGKTTTLNLVYDSLMSLPGAQQVRQKRQLGGNPNDFECVIHVALIPNALPLNIAFYTMGDYAIEVSCAMAYYDGMGVDRLIVANSNFVRPQDRLSLYSNSVNLPKTVDSLNQNAANASDCGRIIGCI